MSTPQWFYAENENRLGPVPLERIADLIMSGGLDRGSLVWRHGMPDWMEAGGVPEIASLLPPPLPPPLPKKPAATVASPSPEPKPEARPEPKPEPRPEPQPEARPEPQPEARSDPKPAAAKVEAKPSQPANPATEAKKGRARTDATARNISELPTLDGAGGAFRGLADALGEQASATVAARVVAPPVVAPPVVAAPVVAAPVAPAPVAPAPVAPAPAAKPPIAATPVAAPPVVTPAPEAIPDDGMVIEEDPPDGPKVAWPSGRLADHEFAELVREVHGRKWTGLLTLNHMGIEKSVRIHDGRLVFASSSSQDDRLGELLLRRGRITLDQYVEAGRGIRKGKRLGTVLVEMGALDARELVKVVVDHTQEIIYGAFQWTEGLYHLTETGDPAEPIVLRLSTPDIILEGIRRIDRWSRIERAVGSLDTRYQRAESYEKSLKQMTLSPDKLALLTGMNDVQELGAICRRSNMPHFEACRTVWAFRVIGVVHRLD